ncbi:hypothetical protein DL95DRAFT_53448 [Leptodontidium sp. 2 PMI_412]|nr:hypothetical protein DL95DRAFT_53448 [Leptodontidium sp. 2 PMI_412]
MLHLSMWNPIASLAMICSLPRILLLQPSAAPSISSLGCIPETICSTIHPLRPVLILSFSRLQKNRSMQSAARRFCSTKALIISHIMVGTSRQARSFRLMFTPSETHIPLPLPQPANSN